MKEFRSIIRQDLLIPLIILIFGLCNFFWGEVIPVAGGLGYDGVVYAEITRTFPQAVLNKNLDTYRFQRILPSGIVYVGLSLFQKSLTDHKILTGFKLYNLGLLVLAAFIYVLIARELKFNMRTRWLGFFGLFLNVGIAKLYYFYPVSTDQTAFVLGLLLLFFFLKDNKIGLLITTILGSFTWPLMIYYGIFLYIFPKKTVEEDEDKAGNRFTLYFSILAVCALFALFLRVYFIKKLLVLGGVQVVAPVVYLSMLSVLTYVFCGLKLALDTIGMPRLKSVFRSTSAGRFAIGLLVLMLVKGIVIFGGTPTILTTQWMVDAIALNSIVRPFGSLVANVVYYGPILLLTSFLWKPFIRIVRQYGLGLSFFIIGNFLLSINTESRMLTPILPFFVVFTAMATQELKWNPSFIWLIGVVSFLYSKIWLRMNIIPINTEQMASGDLFQFPLQYFFMNHGPWMSNQMYVIQGIFVIVTGIILFMLIKWPFLFDNKDVMPE